MNRRTDRLGQYFDVLSRPRRAAISSFASTSRPGCRGLPPGLFFNPEMTDSDQARWFAEEVQPHEPLLRAYLQ
jgi:hypothetical protein